MIKFTILIILFSFGATAQNYEISYLEKIDLTNGSSFEPHKKKCTLLLNEEYSLFSSFNLENTLLDVKKSTDKNGDSSYKINDNDTIYAYKNKNSKTVLVKKIFFTNYKMVLDSLNTINWNLINEKKEILGYECYKAKTNFRGVEFEVFYTSKIPISDGPYNFCGLPGLILYMKLIDTINTYEIEAVSIVNSDKKITNPFEGKKIIPFEIFKKSFKLKREEIWGYGNNTGENKLYKGYLENLIDE